MSQVVVQHKSQSDDDLISILGTCNREGIPFWVPFDQNIPKNAVKAGKQGKQAVYVGRAQHSGSLTPGKVLEADKTFFLPWGCVANEKIDFEILVCGNNNNWVAAEDGHVPENAFPAGFSEQGETLYIGRVEHNGCIITGKVQPSHRVCYIAYGQQELNFRKYEVFVM